MEIGQSGASAIGLEGDTDFTLGPLQCRWPLR